jgi:hypothetical protein
VFPTDNKTANNILFVPEDRTEVRRRELTAQAAWAVRAAREALAESYGHANTGEHAVALVAAALLARHP